MLVRARRSTLFPALLLGALVTPDFAAAQNARLTDDEVRSRIEARLAPQGTPGAVVGLREPDGTRRFFAWGTAGEGRDPLTSASVFEIGSISKAFNGLLLAEMVARGEVALDDPITRWLPDGVAPVPDGRPITLEDLATHRSGLQRLPGNFQVADAADPYAAYTEADLWAFLDGHRPDREPDTAHEYSNLGGGLAGHLLARAGGAPWETLLRERVLAPLAMNETGTELGWPDTRRAAAHDLTGREVPWWRFPTLTATGGLRSTGDDLFRLLDALAVPPEGTLGEAVRESTRPRADAGDGMRIGLFWHAVAVGDRTLVWHNGGTGGSRAILGFDPDSGAGVFVLTNSAHGADDLALHLLEPTVPLQLPEPRGDAVSVDAEVLAKYVGTYRLGPQFAIEVRVEGGSIVVQATGQSAFPTVAESNTRFRLQGVEAAVSFEVDASGRAVALILHQGGLNQRAPRAGG